MILIHIIQSQCKFNTILTFPCWVTARISNFSDIKRFQKMGDLETFLDDANETLNELKDDINVDIDMSAPFDGDSVDDRMNADNDINDFLSINNDDTNMVESNEDNISCNYDSNKINYICIAWIGEPPKVTLHKNAAQSTINPFNDNMDSKDDNELSNTYRKIYFSRNVNDKKNRSIKIWNIPICYNEDDIKEIFSIFVGDINTDIKKCNIFSPYSILDRHCIMSFSNKDIVNIALNYDTKNIIQPYIKGSIPLGLNKWLIQYINNIPKDIDKLKFQVDRFFFHFDNITEMKQKQLQNMPRKNRGYIKLRDKNGFKKIHYVNKHERKKHKAIRLVDDKVCYSVVYLLFGI